MTTRHAGDDIVAYLTGDLLQAEREEFERALATDEGLQRETAALQHTLAKLRALPLPEHGRDLTPLVMARLRASSRRRGVLLRLGKWAAAAAVAIAALGIWREIDNRAVQPLAQTAAQRGQVLACDWLAKHQRSDGGWEVAKHGGKEQHAAGVSGLALLALLAGGEQYADAARRAAEYLLRQQDESGRFGAACSAAMYNHGIAATALLKAYPALATAEMRQALGRAVAFTLRSQTAAGGWGHEGRRDERPNTAVTIWQLTMLQEAAKLGWPDAKIFLERGGRYLGDAINGDNVAYGMESDGPLNALGIATALCLNKYPQPQRQAQARRLYGRALPQITSYLQDGHDLYLAFFLAETKSALADKTSSSILSNYAQHLLLAQVAIGPEAGSVPAHLDPRGSAGGTVYSTALSALVFCRL